MINKAKFELIGNVSKTKEVGTTLRVTIASNYPYKDKSGDWQDDTHWNEVTVFAGKQQDWVKRNIAKGMLVYVEGRLKQTSYEKDGEKVYGTTLAAETFSSLEKKARTEGAKSSRDDDDIAF